MSESEPEMVFKFPDGEFLATRDNSSLFTFMGRLAMYNHAFFVTKEEENKGFYIFSSNPSFNELAEYMLENQYPAHLNLRQVADCDLEAYTQMAVLGVDDELDKGVPEDWQ